MKKKYLIILASFLLAFVIFVCVCAFCIFNVLSNTSDIKIPIDNKNTKKLEAIILKNPNIVNSQISFFDGPALIYSVKTSDIAVVETLLRLGANPNIHGNSRETALLVAILKNKIDIVKLLLKHGASLQERGYRHNSSSLHVAAINGCVNIAKLLIEKGADINAKDMNGSTPLIIAVKNDNIDVVKLLLDKGANINNAIFTAKKCGNKPIIDLLLKHEAKTAKELKADKPTNPKP